MIRRIIKKKKKAKQIKFDINEELPPISSIDLPEEEKIEFIYAAFNKFFLRHINTHNPSETFFDLPVSVFTRENVKRMRQYIDIAFDKIIRDLESGKRENLVDSIEYYKKLKSTIKRKISYNITQLNKQKKEDLISK